MFTKLRGGNTLVMTLAIMLVFSTLTIALSELIETQSIAIDMLIAKSKTEYAAHSGLIHTDTIITEDISTTVNNPISFNYRRRFCVAWISEEGFLRCDDQSEPQKPCCVTDASGLGCLVGNSQGTCLETNQWIATYTARYDSLRQSILSSGTIEFQNLNPDTTWVGNNLSFTKTKEVPLDWE